MKAEVALPKAHAPNGKKAADAPKDWPFGTQEPPPAPPALDTSKLTSLEYLQTVYRDPMQDVKVRIQAASIAAPYEHTKKGEAGGKKAAKEEGAKQAATGKFGAVAPPRLVAANGRKT